MKEYDASPLKDEELLLQKFYQNVIDHGDDVYMTQPGMPEGVVDYTFKQVFDEASKIAGYIKSNVEPGSKIAIISKNCAHFITCEIAIWMSGCTTVALFPNLNQSTTEYIFAHSEPAMVFVGKLEKNDWEEMKGGIPAGLDVVKYPLSPESCEGKKWSEVVGSSDPICADASSAPTRSSDSEAIIVYTSGSTGKPKGVVHTFATLTGPTKGIINMHSITNADRYLSYLPIAHVMDRFIGGCVSMCSGMHVYFAESLTTFKDDLTRSRPTLFVSVPRLWLKFQLGIFSKIKPPTLNFIFKVPLLGKAMKKKLLKALGLDCVRMAGSGSAPIPAELLNWYRELGLELCEGYGMSENFCYSHTTYPGEAKFGFIGKPFPGVEHKLSDEKEILVKSPGTMIGYYKDPEKTAEVLTPDGFLRTGDKGFIDSEGNLKIIGRVKDLFKTSKGKYVAPAPIENIVNNDNNVELSIVCGSGQVATMIIVQLAEHLIPKLGDADTKSSIESGLEKLLKKVNEEVEEYEKAAFVVVAKESWTIEKGFLTPTMKIKRATIEDHYESKLEGWYAAKKKVIWEE